MLVSKDITSRLGNLLDAVASGRFSQAINLEKPAVVVMSIEQYKKFVKADAKTLTYLDISSGAQTEMTHEQQFAPKDFIF